MRCRDIGQKITSYNIPKKKFDPNVRKVIPLQNCLERVNVDSFAMALPHLGASGIGILECQKKKILKEAFCICTLCT